VVGRQPLAQRRRQQQRLISITAKEVLRHPEIVLTTPDDTRLDGIGPKSGTSVLQ
jgi:hypothetical protein